MLHLSPKWAPILTNQPETRTNLQIRALLLTDAQRFDQVYISGSTITRIANSKKIKPPFQESNIEKILVNHGK